MPGKCITVFRNGGTQEATYEYTEKCSQAFRDRVFAGCCCQLGQWPAAQLSRWIREYLRYPGACFPSGEPAASQQPGRTGYQRWHRGLAGLLYSVLHTQHKLIALVALGCWLAEAISLAFGQIGTLALLPVSLDFVQAGVFCSRLPGCSFSHARRR
jgi:hypothetical protein